MIETLYALPSPDVQNLLFLDQLIASHSNTTQLCSAVRVCGRLCCAWTVGQPTDYILPHFIDPMYIYTN
jgi:hypothetical protein